MMRGLGVDSLLTLDLHDIICTCVDSFGPAAFFGFQCEECASTQWRSARLCSHENMLLIHGSNHCLPQIKRLPSTAQFMYPHPCICGHFHHQCCETDHPPRHALFPSACQRKQLNQRGWGLRRRRLRLIPKPRLCQRQKFRREAAVHEAR